VGVDKKWKKTSLGLHTYEPMVMFLFKNRPRGVEKMKFMKNGEIPIMYYVFELKHNWANLVYAIAKKGMRSHRVKEIGCDLIEEIDYLPRLGLTHCDRGGNSAIA